MKILLSEKEIDKTTFGDFIFYIGKIFNFKNGTDFVVQNENLDLWTVTPKIEVMPLSMHLQNLNF